MTGIVVNQTIEVDALDHPATITKTTAGAQLEAGNCYSIHIDPDMDGGATVDLTTSLTIEHDGQSIEVAGYLTISDRAVAESLAHAILAPFLNR